ncbi:MAG: hypothetical protein JW839_09580, partial [Candidatus Lokiarchaeota archaeon]|nr:hypothetical protein [Candidatus Lokiarchaeota archaeon]
NKSSNCIGITVDVRLPRPFTLYSPDAGSPDADGNFTLTWTASGGATNYTMYFSMQYITEINATTLVIAGFTSVTSVPYHVPMDGTYYFIMAARNGSGTTLSNCLPVTVVIAPPGSFTATSDASTPDTDGTFTISWTAASNALTYSVYRHSSFINGINSSLVLVASGIAGLSYKVEDLGDGTHYFAVVAINDAGNRSSNCIAAVVRISGGGGPDPLLAFLTENWLYIVLGSVAVVAIAAAALVSSRRKAAPAKAGKKEKSKRTGAYVDAGAGGGGMAQLTSALAAGTKLPGTAPQAVVPPASADRPETSRTPPAATVEKFYCSRCQKYFDVQNPAWEAWHSCPSCQEPLCLIKSCPSCANPMSLTRELFGQYKGTAVACSHCGAMVQL